jgi:SAM-dependent methyltransferase
MSQADPAVYWAERGKTFEREAHDQGWWGREDPIIADMLRRLHFTSVLDVGCGFGRVGSWIEEIKPDARYTGLDVSPDLIQGARHRLSKAELICADIRTFETHRHWDLVLAVSTLGHLRPLEIGPALDKLRRWAIRDLVTIDWDETGQSTGYQFAHDWRKLYGPDVERIPIGRQSLYHVALERP